MPFYRAKKFHCQNCSWVGFAEEVEWTPFNPIDDFFNVDRQDNPDNIFVFREVCPKCKHGVQYEQTTHQLKE